MRGQCPMNYPVFGCKKYGDGTSITVLVTTKISVLIHTLDVNRVQRYKKYFNIQRQLERQLRSIRGDGLEKE